MHSIFVSNEQIFPVQNSLLDSLYLLSIHKKRTKKNFRQVKRKYTNQNLNILFSQFLYPHKYIFPFTMRKLV